MDERPTHLDLFSGFGGFALAAQWAGFQTIGFCEIDKYCQKIIAQNFDVSDALQWRCDRSEAASAIAGGNGSNNGIFERSCYRSALFSDIRNLDGRDFTGVSLITGGFPCQPFSCAGKRRGKEDDRHLWPEMLRVIKEARPAWLLGENVAGIIGMELDQVLSDLETIGYATRPFVIPACGVDAPHRRNRVWILAHADSAGFRERWRSEPIPSEQHSTECTGQDVADAARDEQGRKEQWTERERIGIRSQQVTITDTDERGFKGRNEQNSRGSESERTERACRWFPEPDVGRVAHGIPRRVDRLKGLGNAIVPQVAYQILKGIKDQIELTHAEPFQNIET